MELIVAALMLLWVAAVPSILIYRIFKVAQRLS